MKLIKYIFKLFFKLKIIFYKNILSDIKIQGARVKAPTIFIGKGKIEANNVQFGYFPSAYYFEGYSHIEARNISSQIRVGEGTIINNCAIIISNSTKIIIGKNCRIGTMFTCFDSDFHGLKTEDRDNQHAIINKDVIIGDNVFIGNNVTVLKGVTIGNNSIIGANSVVSKNIEENSIYSGNPAKLIRKI